MRYVAVLAVLLIVLAAGCIGKQAAETGVAVNGSPEGSQAVPEISEPLDNITLEDIPDFDLNI